MKTLVLAIFCVLTLNTAQAAKLTLEQVRHELYGDDLTHPSADSEIGKYIAETHAAWVVRSFPTAPVGNEIPKYQMGPQKLVVAVGPDSYDKFKARFSTRNYLFQIYEPNDQKMVAGFEGKRGTEGILRDEMIYATPGTLATPILLDSDEGDRAADVFALAKMNFRLVGNPWQLKAADGATYCSMSAFLGCTHWFGGIPIGNTLVDTYYFPHGAEDELGTNPNHKVLSEYLTPAGIPQEFADAIRKVWKVPGHQQLGEMLKSDAFRRGEFANPGWITYTLLGSVGTDRTPVVFLYQDDETAPIAADFALKISAE